MNRSPATGSSDALAGEMSRLSISGTDNNLGTLSPSVIFNRFVQSVEQGMFYAKRLQELEVQKTQSLEFPYTTQGETCALYNRISKLAEAETLIATYVNEAKNAAARSIIQRLTRSRLSSCSSTTRDLLARFEGYTTRVAREVLDTWGDDKYILAKVAEKLYQATQAELDGSLDAKDFYFFQSTDSHDWAEFWLGVLDRCPGGPTIFWGLTNGPDHPIPPHYLFRTFDHRSVGKNNQDVMASRASVDMAPTRRTDILSLGKFAAAEMLHQHLDPPRNGNGYSTEEYPDNLTSWTSSLLYAIQYAIYRCRKFKLDSSEVQICAVDVSKFPKGQFARDSELIRSVQNATNSQKQSKFFSFRLTRHEYYNGEYLSQGEVHLRGRSCFFSLGCLKRSGLYALYPELGQGDKNEWTKRVAALRSSWYYEKLQPIAQKDFEKAHEIAKACVPQDEMRADMRNIALMLLCFKDREGLPTVTGM